MKYKLQITLLISIMLGTSYNMNAQIYLLPTQEFNTDILVHGATAPTTVWFAPNSNTPIDYSASGGNPGGYAMYSSSWNNYWGNFIRIPQVNCSGYDTVTMSFDMSHSYFAAQPSDKIRFYLWDQGASQYRKDVVSIKINGIESMEDFGVNGQGFSFTTSRIWARVEVKFNITPVVNKTNILFYLEPSCGYNNSNAYFVHFDNICITESINPEPSSIDAESGNADVCYGSYASFYVNASGTAPLSYQWYDDYGLMAGADSSAVSFYSATYADTGNYYCIVTNAYGNDTSSVMKLSVNPLPNVDISCYDNIACVNFNEVIVYFNVDDDYSSYLWSTGDTTSVCMVDTSYVDTYGLDSVWIWAEVTDSNYCVARDSEWALFMFCMDVADEQNQSDYNVMPNPANEFFSITEYWNKYNWLTLYDVAGRVIRFWDFRDSKLPDRYNISDIENGIYYLVIGNDIEAILVDKLVIKH